MKVLYLSWGARVVVSHDQQLAHIIIIITCALVVLYSVTGFPQSDSDAGYLYVKLISLQHS